MIGAELVEQCRHVQNKPISEKTARVLIRSPFFKTSLHFIETKDRDLKVHYNHHVLDTLTYIEKRFLYILIFIKYSRNDGIYKN
jgi:hypothetical protein